MSQPITVVISELAVPKCANCGELDFDYVAEQQINDAFRAQIRSLDECAHARNIAMNLTDVVTPNPHS